MAKIQLGEVIDLMTLSKASAPIGDIKHSMLTPAQFSDENLGEWVLCDGRSCAGSAYQATTGNILVPDAVTQGAFLRQRTGIRVLGSYEADDIGFHSHGQRAGGSGGGNTPMVAPAGQGGTVVGTMTNSLAASTSRHIFTDAAGGSETKPKNVAVNFFIKINY